MSTPRKPRLPASAPANDNLRQKPSLEGKPRLPEAEVRLPEGLPVQIVEIEIIALLLESLPANDNGEHGE